MLDTVGVDMNYRHFTSTHDASDMRLFL